MFFDIVFKLIIQYLFDYFQFYGLHYLSMFE